MTRQQGQAHHIERVLVDRTFGRIRRDLPDLGEIGVALPLPLHRRELPDALENIFAVCRQPAHDMLQERLFIERRQRRMGVQQLLQQGGA
jgi:hypothetical protein